MSKRELVKLGELCSDEIDKLSLKESILIDYIDISSVDNQSKKIISFQTIESRDAPSRAKQILKKNDIIVSTVRPNLNAVAINNIESPNTVVASTGYCILRCEKNVDFRYMFNFCKSKVFINSLVKVAKGASYPAVSNSDVKNCLIPIRPLDEQKQIADILDKAQEIINGHNKQLEDLDILIKSIFYEFFGDPVINDKNWNFSSLSELGELGRGVSKHRPRNAPELLGGDYPFIQTGDVANADLYINKYTQTYNEAGIKQSKMWNQGTLCITIAANIAKTAILAFDACFPDSIVGFNAYANTNNIFMHYWFGFFQKIIEAQAPESAQKNINLRILNELKVINPPIELQIKFANIVTGIEEQKTIVKQSITESQNLFNSLMSKYFD